MNKLDTKSHACIMMGYSDESKSYWLFYPIKQKTILRNNVIFDDMTSCMKLLNYYFCLLYNDPLDILEEFRLNIPSFKVLTNQLTIPKWIGSWSISTKNDDTPTWTYKNNWIDPLNICLPQWDVKKYWRCWTWLWLC